MPSWLQPWLKEQSWIARPRVLAARELLLASRPDATCPGPKLLLPPEAESAQGCPVPALPVVADDQLSLLKCCTALSTAQGQQGQTGLGVALQPLAVTEPVPGPLSARRTGASSCSWGRGSRARARGGGEQGSREGTMHCCQPRYCCGLRRSPSFPGDRDGNKGRGKGEKVGKRPGKRNAKGERGSGQG